MPTREEEGQALLKQFGETKYTEGYADGLAKGFVLGTLAVILGGLMQAILLNKRG
jgi:hypothetical protein